MTDKKIKKSIENRDCPSCKGKGLKRSIIWGINGKTGTRECLFCKGTGKVNEARYQQDMRDLDLICQIRGMTEYDKATLQKIKKQIEEEAFKACPSCEGTGSVRGLKVVEGKLRRNILQDCRRCVGTGKISEAQELARPLIKIARTGEPTVYETANEVAERIRNTQRGA